MQLLFSIDKKCSSQHIVRCISYANHTNETLTGSLQMQQITYHCISSKKNYQYPLFIIKDTWLQSLWSVLPEIFKNTIFLVNEWFSET